MTRYRFEIATSDDDPELRRLMALTPMDGSISFTFLREPNYFDANCVLGPERQTIICRDIHRREIVAAGTRSVREMSVDGHATRVGYLSGLRIIGHARRQGLLARGYRFLRELHDADPAAPDYYLTTIAEDNAVAIDQLTSGRAGLPSYQQLCRLHTLVLPVFQRRLSLRPESTGNLQVAPASDLEEVIEFLNAHGGKKTFFPTYQPTDFETANGTFRGLETSSIFVARRHGRIVGVAGLWNQQGFRQNVVSGYWRSLRILRPLLNFWSKLTRGIYLPASGDSLRAAFVCFPSVLTDAADVFGLLMRHLMHDPPADVQCLLVGFCDDDPLLPIARSLSRSSYTTRLYAVSWSSIPSSVVAPGSRPYYLELGCL